MCNENSISSFTEQKTMIALAVSGLGATRAAFYAVYLLCLAPTPYAQKVITPFKILRNMQSVPPTNDYTTPQGGGKQRTMQKKIPHRAGVVITNWEITTSCSWWAGLRSSVGISRIRCIACPMRRCHLCVPPVCLPRSRLASHLAYLSFRCRRQLCG